MDDAESRTREAARLRASWGRRYRVVGWWFVVLVLVLASVLGSEVEPTSQETTTVLPLRDDGKLRISIIKPAEVYEGSTIVIHHTPLSEKERARVRVEIAKRPAEVLHRGSEQLVAQVPSDLPLGRAKVRIFEGERRSKPKDIRLKPRRIRRLLRNVVGGLALFVFGLRTLSRGLRGHAGHPARATIGGWTRGVARGLGFGALAGGIGQSVVSAVALVLGLLQSRLLAFRTALLVLLGAHLGAGIAIIVLPLGVSGESLWLVAAGTLVFTLSRRGRGESLGKVILGVGLVLHGLAVLRSGFEPFVGDPDVLPYMGALAADGAGGASMRFVAGAVLGTILQAPGAIFGLVLGVGESTALLSPRQSLELLAAANIGMSLGTVVVALPFGRAARRFAFAHVGLAVAISLVFFVVASAALSLSGVVLGTDPNELAYGKKVLVPNLAPHLALSYAVAQGISVLLVLPLVGPLSTFLLKLMPERRRLGHGNGEHGEAEQFVSELVLKRALQSNRNTMEATLAALRAGEQVPPSAAGQAISTVRSQLKDAVAELVAAGARVEQMTACVTIIRMQQVLEQLLGLVTRGLQKDYGVDDAAIEAFSVLHGLAEGSITSIVAQLDGTAELDIENARAREIETNTREAELRQGLLASLPEHEGRERDVLWWIEVIGAYEALGNHLYRLAEALVDPADEF